MKVNFTLTVFIAFDRVVALYYPLQYRSLPQMTTAKVALAVGTVIGAVDVMLELIMTVPTHVRGCGALGCFVNPQFGKYWGYSNMALGFVVILLTIVILVKLRKLRKKSNHGTNRNLSFLYTQANRTSIAFLMCSMLFLTLPSVIVGSTELIGVSYFEQIGPFYLLGVLCAGCSYSVVSLIMNKEMRTLLKARICSIKESRRASQVVSIQQDISWMVNKWGQILHDLWLLKLRKRRRGSTVNGKEAHR
ncbi:hypothetical protein Q1695_011474 [Nippostrongylus brasiliensis]|nr:hypothetical protein Q1695_011474 [Nippostrongylus brasiliensis]